MAVLSNIDYKGFNLDAYVCLSSYLTSKFINVSDSKKMYNVNCSIQIFNNAQKEHFLLSDNVVFTIDDLAMVTPKLIYSKIKEKYDGEDII